MMIMRQSYNYPYKVHNGRHTCMIKKYLHYNVLFFGLLE